MWHIFENGTVLATLIASVTTFLTFYLGKRYEKKVELRKIKENQYIDFLSVLAKAKVHESFPKEEINEELSVKIQTIYLVGSKDVQEKLQNFLCLFTDKSKILKTQDELYAELIESMKVDLYGKKLKLTIKNSNSLDKIKYTIFPIKKL